MRRVLLFIISFIVFYLAVQIGWGAASTLLYQPNIAEIWQQCSHLPSQISFGQVTGTPWISWIILIISLGLALVVTLLATKIRRLRN